MVQNNFDLLVLELDVALNLLLWGSNVETLLGLARSKPAPEPADAAEVQAAGGQEAATVPETAAAETKKDA